jgi:signal transduction histidine kinase
MTPDPSLNRLQRRYLAWAEPHYRRMPEDMQRQARAMDQFLYSRRGLGFWFGLLCAVLALSAGLRLSGLAWGLALLLSGGMTVGLLTALVAAWLQPDKVLGKAGLGRTVLQIVGGALLGLLGGLVVGRLMRRGWGGLEQLPAELDRLLRIALPIGLLVGLVLALLIGITAAARRHQLQQELQRARQAREQERVEREASEARLRLLQAQIQPHFIFNTLSAVQHWVDSGDARASALLRGLSAFLRGSAEQMMRPLVKLSEELGLVEHYLRVMQARWGERLRYRLEIDPALAEHAELPPGIVLSLVENALEHGLAPVLSGGELVLRLCRHGPDGGWRLQVSDNGVGLTEDWREGLGLSNSRARLHHAFGPRAHLTLQPAPRGALAEIRVDTRETADAAG